MPDPDNPANASIEAPVDLALPRPQRVSWRSYARLLRDNRNFRRLWLAQMVSEQGDWFYVVAIYSLLLEFTGRAQSVGLALILQVLPQTFIGPSAGVINDRLRRKRVMITADIVRAAVVLCMLLARTRSMVWVIYPLLLMETVMAAFFEPARNAVIPNITRREDVIVANTLSSITWSLNLAIGATLGGVVAVFFGRDTVFVLNSLSFIASALLIGSMRFAEPHVEKLPPVRWQELADFSPVVEGIRYLRSQPRLLVTVFVKAGLGLLVGATWVIYTVMGRQLFPVHLGGLSEERGRVLGMSLLIGARGVGALLGPVIAADWAGQRDPRLRRGILFGFCTAVLTLWLLSVAPNVWLACAAVALTHSGGSVIWTFSSTMLHLYSDDRYRGRVFAADLSFCMLSIAVSAFIAGFATDAGVPARVLAACTGLALLLPAFAWAWAQRLWRDPSTGATRG